MIPLLITKIKFDCGLQIKYKYKSVEKTQTNNFAMVNSPSIGMRMRGYVMIQGLGT